MAKARPRPPNTVSVAEAKGRAMLSWTGKQPLGDVAVPPAQLVDRFVADGQTSASVDWSDWPAHCDRGGLLFQGDNKEVLAHLLATGFRGKVDLIYIDPPFDSGSKYVRRIQLRGGSATLGEQTQYTDIWAYDDYLQFMFERLLLLREFLTETGAIYLHCDWRRVHHLQCLMDEVFGSENLRNLITWKRAPNLGRQAASEQFGRNTDQILYYSRGDKVFFDPPTRLVEVPRASVRYDQDQRRYFTTAPRGDYTDQSIERLRGEGRVHVSSTGNLSIKYFVDEIDGRLYRDQRVDSFWGDIAPRRHAPKRENMNFATQKPEELLSRIIGASCPPGGIVLDAFVGSGTAAAVAQKRGRRWIGCDNSRGAIQTTEKRLLTIIREQADDENRPAQLGFAVHRVGEDAVENSPASARAELQRPTDGRAKVVVSDFVSPSISERVAQAGVLGPRIDDWRTMADSVMIDSAYDGQAFNITLADMPEKKADLVSGTYDFDLPADATAVAVRVTDVLGDEALVVLPLLP